MRIFWHRKGKPNSRRPRRSNSSRGDAVLDRMINLRCWDTDTRGVCLAHTVWVPPSTSAADIPELLLLLLLRQQTER